MVLIKDSLPFNIYEYGINSTEKEEAKKYWELCDIEVCETLAGVFILVSVRLKAGDAWRTF